jgi:hypothetical protein
MEAQLLHGAAKKNKVLAEEDCTIRLPIGSKVGGTNVRDMLDWARLFDSTKLPPLDEKQTLLVQSLFDDIQEYNIKKGHRQRYFWFVQSITQRRSLL